MAVTVTTSYPTKEFKSGHTRLILKLTGANSDTYAWEHPELVDADLVRSVRIMKSTGEVNPTGLTAALTDSNTTTLTFGGSGAGTYTVVIEL